MPKKIRELKALLLKAGFEWRKGKGSHSVWNHKNIDYPITISGKDSDDAKKYQENAVKKAIAKIKEV